MKSSSISPSSWSRRKRRRKISWRRFKPASAITSSSRLPRRRCRKRSTKSLNSTKARRDTMTRSSAAAQRTSQQAGDGQDGSVQLYEELGELARFIDTTMRTLSQFSAPVSATTEQLPQALTHLTDLKL